MEWFYHKDGNRVGPISDADFDHAAATGIVLDKTLVWNDTMPEWQPYGAVDHSPGSGVSAESTLKPVPRPQPFEPPGGETVVCRECGTVSNPNIMIPFEGRWICAGCKDLFFQKVIEGVALETQGKLWEPTGGATPNSEIAAGARDCLRGKVLSTYSVLLLYGVCQFYRGIPSLSWIVQVFLAPPFVVGFARYFLNLAEGEDEEEVVTIFSGFSKYGTCLGAVFLRGLLLYGPMLGGLFLLGVISSFLNSGSGFIFMLGLPILGIVFLVVWHSFFFLEWVIAADEESGVVDSLKTAWNLVNGKRWKLLLLTLRYFFIPGLFLVAGIGSLIALLFGDSGNIDAGFILIFVVAGVFCLWLFLLAPFYFAAVAIFFRDLHLPDYD